MIPSADSCSHDVCEDTRLSLALTTMCCTGQCGTIEILQCLSLRCAKMLRYRGLLLRTIGVQGGVGDGDAKTSAVLPVYSQSGEELLPYFITVANGPIHPATVIAGAS